MAMPDPWLMLCVGEEREDKGKGEGEEEGEGER